MTKTNKGDNRDEIIHSIIEEGDQLNTFVNAGRFAIFPIPSNRKVGLGDKNDIIDVIRKTKAIKIKKININVIYSDKT